MKLICKESYKRSFLLITTFHEDDVIATSGPEETGNNGLPIIPITQAPPVSAPKSPMLSMDDKNKW